MRRPKPDPQYCADCWEEDCFGCEVWDKAHGAEPEETDDDSAGNDGD